MKLYANITNSKGKREGIGDDETIKIELTHRNKITAILRFIEQKEDQTPVLEILKGNQWDEIPTRQTQKGK